MSVIAFVFFFPDSAQENPNTANLSCQQPQNNESSASFYDFNENYKSVYENRNPLLIGSRNELNRGGFFPIQPLKSSLEKLNSQDQNNNTIAPQTTTASGACSTKIRNKKRIVRVRSESRPISALYDIICKEKEICGQSAATTAATEPTTSSTSSSTNDLTKDTMSSSVETKHHHHQPTPSSHFLHHQTAATLQQQPQQLQQQQSKFKYFRNSPNSNGNFVDNLENVPQGGTRFGGRFAKGEKRRHTDGNVQGTLFKLSTAKSAGSECDIISNEKNNLALSHNVNETGVASATASAAAATICAGAAPTTGKR